MSLTPSKVFRRASSSISLIFLLMVVSPPQAHAMAIVGLTQIRLPPGCPGVIVAESTTAVDVVPLDAGRLGVPDLLDEDVDVVDQLVLVEAHLADAGVDVAALVGAVLDLAGLELLDRRGDVAGRRDDGAGLRRRHQAARAEHLTEPANLAHHVLRREGDVEVEPVLLLDLLDQVVAAGEVGAGLLRLGDVVALAEDDHADRLADAVRQRDRAADHLVGLGASMPSFMWISTVSSNLARLSFLSSATACLSGTGPPSRSFFSTFLRWLRSFLPRRGGTPGFFFLGRRTALRPSRRRRGLGWLRRPAASASGAPRASASAGCGALGRRRRLRPARLLPSSSPCEPLGSGVRRVIARLRPLPPRCW